MVINLQNVVACGAGFVSALNYGDNTKAAVIRLGLMEMMKFAKVRASSFILILDQSCP